MTSQLTQNVQNFINYLAKNGREPITAFNPHTNKFFHQKGENFSKFNRCIKNYLPRYIISFYGVDMYNNTTGCQGFVENVKDHKASEKNVLNSINSVCESLAHISGRFHHTLKLNDIENEMMCGREYEHITFDIPNDLIVLYNVRSMKRTYSKVYMVYRIPETYIHNFKEYHEFIHLTFSRHLNTDSVRNILTFLI